VPDLKVIPEPLMFCSYCAMVVWRCWESFDSTVDVRLLGQSGSRHLSLGISSKRNHLKSMGQSEEPYRPGAVL